MIHDVGFYSKSTAVFVDTEYVVPIRGDCEYAEMPCGVSWHHIDRPTTTIFLPCHVMKITTHSF